MLSRWCVCRRYTRSVWDKELQLYDDRFTQLLATHC